MFLYSIRWHTILVSSIIKGAHFDHYNKIETAKPQIELILLVVISVWWAATLKLSYYPIPHQTFNLFFYLYLNGLMVSFIIQWVVVGPYHYCLFWYLYWSRLGHAGRASPIYTLLTLPRLLHPTPCCLPTERVFSACWGSGTLIWGTGTHAHLTPLYLIALGLSCWGRIEKKKEPKL